MGKKPQDPVYMPQEEYDKMREEGYGKEGPRKDSQASERQSQIGNVPKGDKFTADQRKGMLAQPTPEEKPENFRWVSVNDKFKDQRKGMLAQPTPEEKPENFRWVSVNDKFKDLRGESSGNFDSPRNRKVAVVKPQKLDPPVFPSESKEEEKQQGGMGWLGAAGLAVGIGAALFGGYKAYQHFNKDDDDGDKSQTTSSRKK